MSLYRLHGATAALEVALDQLHVAGEVQALVEGVGAWEVRYVGALPPLAGVRVEPRPDDGVAVTGLEADAPVFVTDQLLVRPPWVAAPPGFTGLELVVPRANAFGSGEHGSTQAALRLLHEHWVDGTAAAVDVGTGSGILALYAQRRGCPRVAACDIDPDAVAAARELLPGADVTVGTAAVIPGMSASGRAPATTMTAPAFVAPARGRER